MIWRREGSWRCVIHLYKENSPWAVLPVQGHTIRSCTNSIEIWYNMKIKTAPKTHSSSFLCLHDFDDYAFLFLPECPSAVSLAYVPRLCP